MQGLRHSGLHSWRFAPAAAASLGRLQYISAKLKPVCSSASPHPQPLSRRERGAKRAWPYNA